MTIRDEEGLSLIELVVAIVLIGILGVTATMIFVNSVRAQDTVTTTTEATNTGQLYGQSIERAVRNAAAFDISDSGRLLRVQTTLSGDRQCQAFWVTTPDGSPDNSLYMISLAGALPATDTTFWPRPWHEVGGVESLAANGGVFFKSDGGEVSFAFNIETDAAPVTIRGAAVRRAPSAGGVNPCWV